MTLSIGSKAPLFTLTDDNHETVSLQDFKGKHVVLYFYPKDETPGCTKEACDFRDNFSQFEQKNAVILGVSKDSVASHQKFKKNYQLPMRLLADEQGVACEAYGVWGEKNNFGKKYMGINRTTFLIDPAGNIKHIWRQVKVDGHAEEILKLI